MNDAERLLRLVTAAAARVQNGSRVGLGSGSTAEAFVRALGVRIRNENLQVSGVATSNRTERVAHEAGVPLIALAGDIRLEIGFDGADEIDPRLQLTKGRGGALLFEKIVALACETWIVIAADEKLVQQLGTRIRLPVEIVPFGWESTARRVQSIAGEAALRRRDNGEPFRTDSGNYIVDVSTGLIDDPPALAAALKKTTGVVDHGLFIGLAHEAMVVDTAGVVTSRFP